MKYFSVFNQTSGRYDNFDVDYFQAQVFTRASYTKYTGMDLGGYYTAFLGGLLVHYFLVGIISVVSLKVHRKKFKFDTVLHIFSSLVLPEVNIQLGYPSIL